MSAPDPPRAARITGPRDARRLSPLDPRTAAWRADLADLALAGLVAAPAYAAPVVRTNTGAAVMMHDAATHGALAVSELLPGETFAVLEESGGWCWGYSVHDHYVGYVPAAALGAASPATHMAGPGDALLFAAPDIKAPVRATIPAGSRLAVTGQSGPDFLETAGGHIHAAHLLEPEGAPGHDWVAFAEGFLGSPYRWGGRTRAGIDCSGLVQVARLLAGRPIGRDSDMQAKAARPVARAAAARGDIACWPGHIGILLDKHRLLHATAHGMTTRIEHLADVEARNGPAELRRLPG